MGGSHEIPSARPAEPLVIGTRGSRLALWQAHHVRDRLEAAGHRVEVRTFTTQGDRILDVPLADIGSKALFTKELDVALLRGEIHLAVHSLKDLPTRLPDGLVIAAVGRRADARDAFVPHPSKARRLSDVPDGGVIATSSLRRQAQLKAWRSDLRVVSVRGNVPTRIEKLDRSDWDGMLLAAAGLDRLELGGRIGERLEADVMVPAVGQGALGIVCAAEEGGLRSVLAEVLDHRDTRLATRAERALMRRLEGGCQVPIGGHATVRGDELVLVGCITSLDGRAMHRFEIDGPAAEAEALGIALAERLLTAGGDRILQAIRTA